MRFPVGLYDVIGLKSPAGFFAVAAVGADAAPFLLYIIMFISAPGLPSATEESAGSVSDT